MTLPEGEELEAVCLAPFLSKKQRGCLVGFVH